MSSVGVPFATRALLRPRLSTQYFPTNTAFPNISHHGRVAISGNARNASSITKVFYKIIPRSNAQAIRPKWLFAGASLAAAVIGFYVSESPYHAVMALERTMRVASATARCIQDYRYTLALDNASFDYASSLSACHKRCSQRALNVMEKNGSIFIKLGQHLSSMTYLLPIEWTSTFIPLQDKCPRSSVEDIDRMIQKDIGCTISELFSEFDEEPIGTGKSYSRHTAQVSILSSRADFSPSKKHPWLRFTGLGYGRVVKSKVAVKLQHPSLAEWVPLDLALTRFALTNIKFFFPEYPMDWLSEEMELSLPVELDFEEEAKNIYRVTEHFKHVPNTALVVPRVVWAKKRILVLEYLRGHRVDDLSSLDRAGISRDEVSASLAHIFNEMIFGNNAPLHCDPHHGNLAIRPNQNRKGHNFDIILYDHGLYREIPLSTRRSYAKLWLAVLDGDEDKMRIYASEVAGITAEQFPLFASAITGRDFVTVKASVSTARSETEKEHIAAAMADGMLSQLVQLLANVPRIILLILKTNDLSMKHPQVQKRKSNKC
ncbi:hypothetical protein TWF102_008956 [Orbilia oligospora]|uniref:ABC1 atypical kinase-like domain-containing protein n=1 Tax=Orbilia oligospora TaxID=2813651 RepID=A0A7C8N8W8_ORBOL|nr:hypothetical protein TWF102_008956 [Orbilia oligospora]KAF3097896.1 hypothetical protein TWF103_009279 [Orbilia oligospora]KAF3131756.1 hypothetical protein TWF594_009778 [Orbilia oligospora]